MLSAQIDLVGAVAVTHDGGEVVTGGSDGTARIWNRRTGEQRATLSAGRCRGHRQWRGRRPEWPGPDGPVWLVTSAVMP
jgi:WD40 repeat protein